MADNKSGDLSIYRMQNALETLDTAKLCLDNKKYKDTINRCYYAAFYGIKAVLALEEKDFKRHKDAVAYFNQNYVAAGIFKRETGKLLGRLK
ncbi:HEPN domain-containing protein [Ruminococcus sp. 5_1_39BFAA]|uniref:HEPN domain-containing protein n=1 Tax=Ruminococcus sp. 5_1_39BFAA TaxID=457412 RepID=UPI003567F79E